MLTGSRDEEWARDARLELFQQGITEAGLPVLLMFLLTREPVKALFVRRPRKRG